MSDSDLLKAISEIREGWQLQEKIDKAEETLRQKKMAQYAQQARIAEGRAEEILKKAKSEAAVIIEDGRQQANTFLQSQEEEWKTKNDAWNQEIQAKQQDLDQKLIVAEKRESQGYESGKASGYDAGYKEGLDKFQGMLKSLDDVIDNIRSQEKALYEANLQHMKDFIKVYTEKVIGQLSASRTDAVFHNIQTALLEVHRANHLKVVVSSHDFEAINAVKEQFDGLFSPVKRVELLEDKNMSVGGCLLETELGNVDATIDSQMALLWLELNND
tara:strand:+ start:462 stop:1280 length:819 start_codon:yes stop_codon:yes gene_type:complete